jgi:fibronectin-binding autotransporter adhesin
MKMRIFCPSLRSYLLNSQLNRRILVVFLLISFFIPSAYASYTPLNTYVGGNVGVGTATPQGKFVVIGGNVGIGTWSPAAPLDVSGNLNFSNGNQTITTGPNGTGAYNLTIQPAAATPGGNLTVSSGNGSGAGSTSGNLILTSGNAGTFATTSGSVTISSGNGGNSSGSISLSTPSVNGTAGSISLYVGSSSGSKGTVTLQTSGGNIGIGTTAPLSSLELGVRKIDILSNGNVGIGSLTPGQTLDVNGTIRSISGGFVFPDGSIQTAAATGGSSWSMSNGNVYTTTGSNNVGIGTSTPQGGLIVTNGNVGIGTWMPIHPLQVGANPSTVSSFIEDPHDIFSVNDPSYGLFALTGTSANSDVGFGLNQGSGLGTSGNAFSIFGIVGNSTDNFDGLDNANSGQSSGTILWQTYYNNAFHPIIIIPPGTNNSVFGGNVGIGTAFVGGAGEAALSIMNGNVGIGTWVPAGRLSIIGSGTATNTAFQVSDASNTSRYSILDNGQVTFSTNGQNVFLVNSGSNNTPGLFEQSNNENSLYFGLRDSATTGCGASGSNNGLFKWTVVNTNNTIERYTPFAFYTGGTSFPSTRPLMGPTASGGCIDLGLGATGGSTTDSLTFWTNSLERLRIDNTGNIGIGSLAPGQALDVTGTVRATGFIAGAGGITLGGVNNTSWPAGGSSNWLYSSSGNVGLSTTVAVGIGTTFVGGTGEAALSVMNGNVGIGTWVPTSTLQVIGSFSAGLGNLLVTAGGSVNLNNANVTNSVNLQKGNVGIGTNLEAAALSVMDGNVGIGTWIVDSGALIVNTGNNVGIGTIRPGQALDVNGTVRAIRFLGDGSQLTGISVSSGWTLGTGNVGISTTNNVGIGTNLTTTAGLTVMNGNVGVGTWVPRATMELRSDVNSQNSPAIYFSNPNLNHGFTNNLPTDIAGSIGMYSNPGGLLIQGLNRGQGTGLVLVGGDGTTTPNAGTPSILMFGGKSSGASIGQLGDNDTLLQIWNGGTTSPNTQPFTIMGSMNVGIGTSTPLGALTVMNGNVGIGTWVPAAALDVAGSGNSYINGNLGIGSTAPGKAVDVQGVVRMTGFNLSSSPVNGYVLTSDASGNGTWASSGGAGGGWSTGTGTVYTSTGSNNVGIGTSTPQGGLVVTNGNVGIGTWSPAYTLDVNGNINSNNSTITAWTVVAHGATLGGNADNILSTNGFMNINAQTYGLTFPSTSSLSLTVNNADALHIDGQGNVGIGSTAPSNQLEVVSSTGQSNVLIKSTTDSASIAVQTAVTNKGAYATVDGNYEGWFNMHALSNPSNDKWWRFGTGGVPTNGGFGVQTLNDAGNAILSTPFIIGTGGNVGIGTTVPYAGSSYGGGNEFDRAAISSPKYTALIVDSSIDDGSSVQLWSNGTPGAVMGFNSASGAINVFNIGAVKSGSSMQLSTPGGVLAISNGGNVGIGTWVPAQFLDVEYPSAAVQAQFGNTIPTYLISNSPNVGFNAYYNGGWKYGKGSSGVYGSALGFNQITGVLQYFVSNTTGNADAAISPFNDLFNITQNGNVGIGSVNPMGTLDVGSGTICLGHTCNSSWPAGSGSSNWLYSSSGNVGLSTTAAVGIGTTFVGGAGEGALTVMNGNVGIGTWVPGQALQVGNGIAPFTVSSAGNVSIGTTLNNDTLNVKGDVSTTANVYLCNSGSFSGCPGQFNANGTNNNGASAVKFLASNSGTHIEFIPAQASQAMDIDSNGNVGIGTWQAVSTLFVNGNVGIGTTGSAYISNSAPANGLIVQGNVGIGTWIPSASINVNGTVSLTPSAATNITAGGGITVTRTIMRVAGSGGAVTVTANPAIAAGSDGQEVIILGTDSTNTVTLTNGNGLQLAGGVSFTFNKGSTMSLIYDAVNSKWVEVSRSAN